MLATGTALVRRDRHTDSVCKRTWHQYVRSLMGETPSVINRSNNHNNDIFHTRSHSHGASTNFNFTFKCFIKTHLGIREMPICIRVINWHKANFARLDAGHNLFPRESSPGTTALPHHGFPILPICVRSRSPQRLSTPAKHLVLLSVPG
jgi:hypothetical protein